MKTKATILSLVIFMGVVPGLRSSTVPVSVGSSYFWPEAKDFSKQLYLTLEIGSLVVDELTVPLEHPETYIDGLLKAKKKKTIAVYFRAGTTFGEVCRMLDILRKTQAEEILVYPRELGKGERLPKDARQ